jgi:cyd operon protein YbgT
MWYFAWILGLGFALAFGVINAIWFEILEPDKPASKSRGTEAHEP